MVGAERKPYIPVVLSREEVDEGPDLFTGSVELTRGWVKLRGECQDLVLRVRRG